MGILDNMENERKPWEDEPKGLKNKKTLLYFTGVVLLLAGAIGGSFYVVRQKPEILGLSKNANEEATRDIERYTREVGELMLLPDETPTLATVSDVEQVKDQPFFKNAVVGDIVLVYRGARKAILYRPSEKRIIEVGVVNVNEESSTQNSSNESQVDVELLPSVTVTPTPSISLTPAFTPTSSPTPAPSVTPSFTPTPTP